MTSSLFKSVFAADIEGVLQCLRDGINPNERGTNGETPLMVAAREGYVRIANNLRSFGADISLLDDFGKTALTHAFLAEQGEAVHWLLRWGAEFDLLSVLHIAHDWQRKHRPSILVNHRVYRGKLAKIAEANGIQIGRGFKSTTLEYRRFPNGGRDVVLSIDLHLPEPMPKDAPPLFVFVHGGSWTSGTKRDEPVWLATKLGFAAASIDYRLTTQAAFPAPVKDCKAAIRFLRSHAWEYGYDPDRIGVLGNSAGGHLALLLGLTPDDPDLDRDAGDPNVSSAVQAVCSMGGPADADAYIRLLRLLVQAADEKDEEKRRRIAKTLLKDRHVAFLVSQKDNLPGVGKAAANLSLKLLKSGFPLAFRALRLLAERKIANDYFCGESPLDHQDIFNAINPLWQAKRIAEMPPERRVKVAKFFLAYGKRDPLVPVDGATDLSLELDDVGVPNEFHEIREAGHDTSAMFPLAFRFLKENLNS